MRTCPRCGRAFAEVVGAPDQACPHCGLVLRDEPIGPAPGPETHADPVAAAALAFRLFAKHYVRLSIVWVPAVVANFLAIWAVLAYTRAQGLSLDAPTFQDQLRILGVAVPAFAASFVVELACWSLVANVALGTAAKPRFRATLAMGAMLAVAYTLGLALLVVPFLVFFHWYMYAPAALATGESPSKAFESSRAFARERHTAGFTALVLLVWIAVGLVLTFVLEPIFEAPLRLAGDAGIAFADALAGWVLNPLVPLFPAAYWSLARQTAAQPVAPSPQLAPAAPERFATTTCPQCGTLIAYTPTGASVDVTCATCGRVGRVL